MTASTYRPELPEVPERMRWLPIRRGYPVPWFVPMVNGDYHFPAADALKMKVAIKEKRCWVCGDKLGAYRAFVLGPMCAINRTTSEPPSHRECAEFSAKACPFLARPHMKRRPEELQPGGHTPPAGIYLDRNPGVALVWITKEFWLRPVPNIPGVQRGGVLFRIGEPTSVAWYAEGREATRAEVLASIESGLPKLREVATEEGPDALRELESLTALAMKLIPQEQAA
jgi:hypothetical protein